MKKCPVCASIGFSGKCEICGWREETKIERGFRITVIIVLAMVILLLFLAALI